MNPRQRNPHRSASASRIPADHSTKSPSTWWRLHDHRFMASSRHTMHSVLQIRHREPTQITLRSRISCYSRDSRRDMTVRLHLYMARLLSLTTWICRLAATLVVLVRLYMVLRHQLTKFRIPHCEMTWYSSPIVTPFMGARFVLELELVTESITRTPSSVGRT